MSSARSCPGNYPFEVLINKIGPILATGNTVVVKPAPDTPWSATRIGRLIAEKTDIPAGVVNIVTSSDHLVGELLTLDPRVDLISFTGSTVTGKRIMKKGAATLKRVFLELGGKSAAIILDDADFASVVPAGINVCLHAGQGCAMQTRMLLPRYPLRRGRRADHRRHAERALGDPTDPAVLMGPLVSALQRDRVTASSARAKPKARNSWSAAPTDRPGSSGVTTSSRPCSSTSTRDGHRAGRGVRAGPGRHSLRRRRRRRAHRQRQHLRPVRRHPIRLGGPSDGDGPTDPYGSLNINASSWYGADSPYGGYKTSGVGRQNGIEGFEQYTETKALSLPE